MSGSADVSSKAMMAEVMVMVRVRVSGRVSGSVEVGSGSGQESGSGFGSVYLKQQSLCRAEKELGYHLW